MTKEWGELNINWHLEAFGAFYTPFWAAMVTMTTALDLCLDTLCSENTMVLSARRGFLHACIF
jgi:hypothetical protein